MGNSPLVTYVKLSPNHYNGRISKIDTITPHCVVGHLSLQSLGNIFLPTSRKASSNYGIDDYGQVGMYCEEKNASWCSSSYSNDHRAITIEIASDVSHPYKMTNAAIQGLINLSVDICKRNNIPKLLWQANKALVGQVGSQNITVHRWFAAKSCPGDYLYNQLGQIAFEVNKILIAKPQVFVPYLVKINTSSLNYRRGAGTNFPIVGAVKQNEVYTIVEEASGLGASKWGKLKSGAGWISLDFCIRLW